MMISVFHTNSKTKRRTNLAGWGLSLIDANHANNPLQESDHAVSPIYRLPGFQKAWGSRGQLSFLWALSSLLVKSGQASAGCPRPFASLEAPPLKIVMLGPSSKSDSSGHSSRISVIPASKQNPSSSCRTVEASRKETRWA